VGSRERWGNLDSRLTGIPQKKSVKPFNPHPKSVNRPIPQDPIVKPIRLPVDKTLDSY